MTFSTLFYWVLWNQEIAIFSHCIFTWILNCMHKVCHTWHGKYIQMTVQTRKRNSGKKSTRWMNLIFAIIAMRIWRSSFFGNIQINGDEHGHKATWVYFSLVFFCTYMLVIWFSIIVACVLLRCINFIHFTSLFFSLQ